MLKESKAVTTKATYQNPAGEDEVGFTLYVDSTSMIVDVKTEILSTHAISKKRQEAFAEGFPVALKGKKLSELTVLIKSVVLHLPQKRSMTRSRSSSLRSSEIEERIRPFVSSIFLE